MEGIDGIEGKPNGRDILSLGDPSGELALNGVPGLDPKQLSKKLKPSSVRPKESASEASPHSEEATELGTWIRRFNRCKRWFTERSTSVWRALNWSKDAWISSKSRNSFSVRPPLEISFSNGLSPTSPDRADPSSGMVLKFLGLVGGESSSLSAIEKNSGALGPFVPGDGAVAAILEVASRSKGVPALASATAFGSCVAVCTARTAAAAASADAVGALEALSSINCTKGR